LIGRRLGLRTSQRPTGFLFEREVIGERIRDKIFLEQLEKLPYPQSDAPARRQHCGDGGAITEATEAVSKRWPVLRGTESSNPGLSTGESCRRSVAHGA
jgi:hypothetical protein